MKRFAANFAFRVIRTGQEFTVNVVPIYLSAMKKSAAILVSDCLGEVTRKERRSLLGISMLSIAMTHAKLVPTKISALGVDFDQANQERFLLIIALVVGYYLLAFLIYGLADFSVWQLRFSEVAIKDTGDHKQLLIDSSKADLYEQEPDEEEKTHLSISESKSINSRLFKLSRSSSRWIDFAPVISILRVLFDFVLPILVAPYAIYWLTCRC